MTTPLTATAMFWYEVAQAIIRHEDADIRHLGERINNTQRRYMGNERITLEFTDKELITAFFAIKGMGTE